MCMVDKSCDAWPEAIADDDASLLWFDAKSSFLPKNCRKLLYQRTTGSSKRITMCSTNIHARTQVQLTAHKSPTREAQIVQSNVRQQESYQQQKYIMTTALDASNAAPCCSSSRRVCHPLLRKNLI